MIILPIRTTSFIHFLFKAGWEYVLFDLRSESVNPFTPKSDQFQVSPAELHQKHYITQYEDLGFSWLTQMKDDCTANSHYHAYTFIFKRLGEYTF